MKKQMLWQGIFLFLIVGSLAHATLFKPGKMQEDAFITARYAQNLANGHGFTFNLDEKVLGTTTPGWALVVTPLFWIPTSSQCHAYLIQLLGFLLFYAGVYVLGTSSIFKSRFQMLMYFILMALHPAMRHAAVSGMETPVLIFLTAIAWKILDEEKDKIFSWGLLALICFLLMAVRLDSVFICLAFGGVYTFLHLRDTRTLKRILLCIGSAGALLLLFLFGLYLYFGQWLPQSMVAKTAWSYVAEPKPLRLSDYAEVLYGLLWFNFPWPRIICPKLINHVWAATSFLFLGGAYLKIAKISSIRTFMKGTVFYIALYSSFFFIGRADIFPWYGHVASFLFYSALIAGLLHFSDWKAMRYSFLLLLFLVLVATHIIDLRILQIYGTRTNSDLLEIGKYLSQKSVRTVMTEPIGYIGFFSNALHVYDLAGLVDKKVFELRKQNQTGWFSSAVRKFSPQFIVLREGEIQKNNAVNIGVLFADEEDKLFFRENYKQVRLHGEDHTTEKVNSFTVYRRLE